MLDKSEPKPAFLLPSNNDYLFTAFNAPNVARAYIHLKSVRVHLKDVRSHLKGVRIHLKDVRPHLISVRPPLKGRLLRFVLLAAPYIFRYYTRHAFKD